MCSRYLLRLLLREGMRVMVVTLWLNQGGTAFSTSLTALVRSEAFLFFDCKKFIIEGENHYALRFCRY